MIFPLPEPCCFPLRDTKRSQELQAVGLARYGGRLELLTQRWRQYNALGFRFSCYSRAGIFRQKVYHEAADRLLGLRSR